MTTKRADALLIGLDIGSSAVKGVVIDRSGAMVAEAEKELRPLEPREGWVELDPTQHWQDVCEVIRTLASAGPIAAIAMAAASGNTLLADADGEPLTRIISWMDQRTMQRLPAALEGLTAGEVRQIVGWPCVDRFPLAHLAWFRENMPEVFSHAVRCCMNTDWLLFRLSGQWVMDASTATTFHLQEQAAERFYLPFLRRLGIDERRLSRIVPSGTRVGRLTERAMRETGLGPDTEVVAGCFDHPAAARAVGVIEPGQLMLSCGTSWVGFFPDMDRQRIVNAELLCDPFLSGRGGPWGAMFSVPAIGRTINWYIDHLIAPGETDRLRRFNELSAQSQPGAGGVKIDLRVPPTPVKAERSHISRAVMEGAARLLHDRMRELEARGIRFTQAKMVGGPSRSPIWFRIVEEIMGIPVAVGSSHAGAKGAALLAGIGVGVWKDEDEALRKTQ